MPANYFEELEDKDRGKASSWILPMVMWPSIENADLTTKGGRPGSYWWPNPSIKPDGSAERAYSAKQRWVRKPDDGALAPTTHEIFHELGLHC